MPKKNEEVMEIILALLRERGGSMPLSEFFPWIVSKTGEDKEIISRALDKMKAQALISQDEITQEGKELFIRLLS